MNISNLKELYKADRLPVFQNHMFNTHEEAINCVTGDMLLAQNLETGLISNQAFNPELMQYDAGYQNEQAHSNIFQKHLHDVVNVIQRNFQNATLIEVGCGKGYFLEQLQSLGFTITGLDPAYEGNNPDIIKEYFTPFTGLQANGLILRHVLEHVRNPVEFLVNLRDANGSQGQIYIEVPCFDWICQHRAWFDVFYEHVNYFRLSDFKRMFSHIHEAGHLFGGQYIYVVADLASIHEPIRDKSDNFIFPADFLDSVDEFSRTIKTHGNSSVVWGAASKGVIFSLFMQRAEANINFVVDINPAKQGRFLAATGLRVEAPETIIDRLEADAHIFVMNGNYLPEIKKLTNNQFNYITVDHESI